MSDIAIIYGSSRPSRRGEVVAMWVKQKLNVEADMIDLAEENLPLINEPVSPIANDYQFDHTKNWSKKINQYKGYIFIVAEYNLGYTPILKNAIDTLFHEWKEKPAALVSYGSFDKSTAAEQLRTVLTPFKMRQVETNVHITPIGEAADSGKLDETKVVGDIDKLVKEFESLLE